MWRSLCLENSNFLTFSLNFNRKPGRAGEVKVHVGYVAHISSLSDSIHTEGVIVETETTLYDSKLI